MTHSSGFCTRDCQKLAVVFLGGLSFKCAGNEAPMLEATWVVCCPEDEPELIDSHCKDTLEVEADPLFPEGPQSSMELSLTA